jgi:hypothetical protein
MNRTLLYWVALLLVLGGGHVYAEGLKPFAPHKNYRSPHDTIVAAQKAGNFDQLALELSRNSSGLSPADVVHRVQSQQWHVLAPCPGCRYLFAGISGKKRIGYLARSLQPGEQLVCIDATACFSTYCANPTKILAPPPPPPVVHELPPKPDCVETDDRVAYSTSSVHGPSVGYGGGWFIPFGIQGGTSIDSTTSHHNWTMCVPSSESGDKK